MTETTNDRLRRIQAEELANVRYVRPDCVPLAAKAEVSGG